MAETHKSTVVRGSERKLDVNADLVTFQALASQNAIWRASKSNDEANAAHNEAFAVELKGSLDEDVLVRALQMLPTIHPALRSFFVSDGTVLAVPHTSPFSVERENLTALPTAEAKHRLETIVDDFACRPYDLAHGPLFRACVIRVGEGHHVVLIGSHHSVCDGWSLDVLLADLSKIYCAMTGFGPFPDPHRPSAVDFQAYCATPEYQERQRVAREFWRRSLQVPPEANLLAKGRQPHDEQTPKTHFARHSIALDQYEAIRRFARSNGLSMFTALYAGFVALLQRITGSDDLVVCIPVARHPEAEMEDSVGNFVNIVPVRCAATGSMSFLSLCRFVHQRLLDAREHASLDLVEIVEALGSAGDETAEALRLARLVPVHRYTAEELPFGDAAVEYEGVPRRRDLFDLSLYVMQAHDNLELRCSVRQHLFDAEWVSTRLRELGALLVHGATAPATPIEALRTDHRLRAAPLAATGPRHPSPPPRNDVDLALQQLFARKLPIDDVGIHDDFFESGGNSRLAAELVQDINAALDSNLDVNDLVERPTVAQLSSIVRDRNKPHPDMVVPLNQPRPDKPVLIFACGIALYGPLARLLNDDYGCYGIFVSEEEKFFGSQDADGSMTIESLASLYIHALKKTVPHGPYALAGVSFGGILAFEIARQLASAGDDVSGLVLLDAALPSAFRRDWARTARSVTRHLRMGEARQLLRRARELVASGRSSKAEACADDARQARNAQLWRAVRGGATTRFLASTPTYDAPVLIVRAANREGYENHRSAPELGWGPHLRGPITLADAPGTHLGILQSPQTAEFIRRHVGRPTPFKAKR